MTRTLALLLLAAAPARALTPDELWSAWQAQAVGFGATLSAEAVPGGDGSLTLRGWTLAVPGLPPEPLPPESPIQEVTLRPAADGSVTIDLGIPPGGLVVGDAAGEVRLDDDGLVVTARDGADGIDYEVAADALRVAIHAADPFDPVASTDAAFEIAGLRLRFPGQLGPDRRAAVELSIAGYAYVASVPEAFTGAVSHQAGRVEGDMGLTAAMTLPAILFAGRMDEAVFLQALRDGLALRIDLANGVTTQEAWFEGFPFSYHLTATSEPGTGFVAADASQIAFGGAYDGGTVSATSPQLPFPELDVTFGRLSGEFRVPLGPDPGEFAYRVALEDVAVNEEAWAFLDPQGLLSREAARFAVDVTGRATIDAAATLAAGAAGRPPSAPSIESLDIHALELSGAGLSATGSGAFTFDNNTGVPQPSGTATARVEGLDRLLDALVALGAITDQDARNARLGLATVFRAGDGPDVRVTNVEARPDGTVLVNGLPFAP